MLCKDTYLAANINIQYIYIYSLNVNNVYKGRKETIKSATLNTQDELVTIINNKNLV